VYLEENLIFPKCEGLSCLDGKCPVLISWSQD